MKYLVKLFNTKLPADEIPGRTTRPTKPWTPAPVDIFNDCVLMFDLSVRLYFYHKAVHHLSTFSWSKAMQDPPPVNTSETSLIHHWGDEDWQQPLPYSWNVITVSHQHTPPPRLHLGETVWRLPRLSADSVIPACPPQPLSVMLLQKQLSLAWCLHSNNFIYTLSAAAEGGQGDVFGLAGTIWHWIIITAGTWLSHSYITKLINAFHVETSETCSAK